MKTFASAIQSYRTQSLNNVNDNFLVWYLKFYNYKVTSVYIYIYVKYNIILFQKMDVETCLHVIYVFKQ